jgi:hypothetical protein
MNNSNHPPTDDPSLPSYQCPDYNQRLEVWQTMSDAFRGRLNKVNDPERYLPSETNEPREAYPKRLARSPYENHTKKIITGYAGAISGLGFAEDLPKDLADIEDDIDLCGASFRVFCEGIDTSSLRDQYSFVMVDFYRPESIISRADERKTPPRPFIRAVDARQVINWKAENGRIARATIKEEHCRPSGYGEIEEIVYRVIKGDYWRVVRVTELNATGKDGKKLWIEEPVTDENSKPLAGQFLNAKGLPLGYCPLIPYTLTANDWDGDNLPEFIDLADLNIALYQSISDWRAIVKSLCPVPWVKADSTARITNQAGNLSLGPHDFLDLGSAPQAECGYLQADPAAVAPAYDVVKDLRSQIKAMSLNDLAGSTHQRTATEIRTAFADTQKRIERYATQKESAINNVLKVVADFMGIDEDLPKATVISDISALLTDEKSIALLAGANLLSQESAVKRLEQLGFNSGAAEELLRLKAEEAEQVGELAKKMDNSEY